MKSAAKNIQIASYDDLFKTDAERQADTQERVQSLPLDKLVPFPNHPFKVRDAGDRGEYPGTGRVDSHSGTATK